MPHRHVAKWFHRIGPLNWYKGEWVRFEFEIGGRVFAMIWKAGQFVWIFGGKVVAREDFGLPAVVRGGLHFTI